MGHGLKRLLLGVLSFTIVGVSWGCTYTFAARLYDLSGGDAIPATFRWNGSGRGPVEMMLPSGEACRGEYITVPDDAMSWGQIFAVGARGMSTATGYALTTQGMQRGTAIATGSAGTTIECEYVTSASTPQGYGTCRDNRNKTYRLMFGGRAAGSQ